MHIFNKSAGLSLIELLVALALSSFLLLGVSTIFLDNKQNYVFQQNQSENIESSRYAFLLLQDQLAKAGYRRRPDMPMDEAYRASSALGCNFSAGQAVKQRPSTPAKTNDICMRYEPRTDKDRDCLGNLPVNAVALKDAPYTDGKEIIVQRFFLDQNNALFCEVAHVIDGSVQASQSGELLTNVADLQFEYAEASASSPQQFNNYTKDPSNPVIAVRYAGLVRSTGVKQRDSLATDEALSEWAKLTGLSKTDAKYQSLSKADNGNIYQISQSAIMLRNLMP